jgi:SSS family solute:Na+ symporter
MGVLTLIKPLTEPKEMPVRDEIELGTSPIVLILGGLVILCVIAFYIIFW